MRKRGVNPTPEVQLWALS